MRTTLSLLVLFLFSTAGFSITIHVPGDYPLIQQAIDAAVYGDTVLVHPGTYPENINFKGKGITVRSEMGPGQTVIDGTQSHAGVRFLSGENFDSVLEGFTVFNGTAGVTCHTQSSPTLIRNVITGSLNGYGITCHTFSSPLIHENVIHGNAGGGIQCLDNCAPEIQDNQIYDNNKFGIILGTDSMPKIRRNLVRGHSAAGIHVMSAKAGVIRDNLVFEHTDKTIAGLRCSSSSNIDIVNNVICDNDAAGIWLSTSSDIRIINNTVSGNSRAGLHCFQSSATAANSIFWNNAFSNACGIEVEYESSLSISYSDSEGGLEAVYVSGDSQLTWGPKMIDDDPLFVDPSKGDYHLIFHSPCRSKGDDAVPGFPDHDFEGDPRIAYGPVDIGADELYTHLYHTGDAVPGNVVELKVAGFPGGQVQVWLGSGVMDPPMPTQYGEWHLQFPLPAHAVLGKIPTMGNLVLPFTIPASVPTPLLLPFQAGVGEELTNLSVMMVK